MIALRHIDHHLQGTMIGDDGAVRVLSSDAQAALDKLIADARADWQPISTAPKDGSWILASSPKWEGDCEIVGWHFGAWRAEADPDESAYSVTHWMPLPEPPTRINEPQEGKL